MLIDEAEITVKAGNGGRGLISFRHEKFIPKGGPSGGNGGKGGDVYLMGVTDIGALRQFRFKKSFEAKNGQSGLPDKKSGKNSEDLIIKLPIGSVIKENESTDVYEITKENEMILVAKGGKGGQGNWHFRTSTDQAPQFAEHGIPGQFKTLKIELRLIAEIGLIGLPNAGKTSLLNELTNASAKVANYPFTTLEPNLGVMDDHIVADIPGLIEGAADGKGLGDKFLRHIQRTKVLVHCLSLESDNIKRDYEVVRKELSNFNPDLLQKEEIILLTKSDMVEEKIKTKSEKMMKKINPNVLVVSIHDWDSLQKLRAIINSHLQ